MFAETIASTSKPRTRAFNAYRHGLTGHVLVIEPAEEQAYKEHCRGILQSLAPSGALETNLAQSVADDRWRLMRAAAMETNILACGLNEPDDAFSSNAQVDTALATARVWLERGKEFNLITLYENRIQRRVEKNIALIQQLQQTRREAFKQAAEETRLLTQLAASKGESFDPARDFPVEAWPAQLDFSNPETARALRHFTRLAEAKSSLSLPRAA